MKTILQIFERLRASWNYFLLQTTRKPCCQPEMPSWIQTTIHQNAIIDFESPLNSHLWHWHVLLDWFIHCFYPPNGICIQNTISGLKMIVKSGLEKYILKSLYAERLFFIAEFLICVTFMNYKKVVSRMEEFQKYFFLTAC